MIKADVVYDKNALCGLMKFNAIDKPWKWIVYALATALVIFWFFANIGRDYFPFYTVLLILIAIIDGLVIFSYFILPKLKLKNFTEDQIVLNHFTFTEDVIKISSESKKRKGSSELKYNVIFRACETKDAFYFFVNKKGALIITKSSITEGTDNDLRALVNSKIVDKRRNKLSKNQMP